MRRLVSGEQKYFSTTLALRDMTNPLSCAQDFACGLPLRSRPQRLRKESRSFDSLRSLRISPAGSRSAHARRTAQLNKTFCYLFTQKGCLFEMIIRTYLS
jgi:hypothetical protein